MNEIKQLAGQTAIYGLSSFLPRFLNYLLVPFYTRIFLPPEYGIITEFYAYVTFLLILLTYGMETGFFKFSGTEIKKGSVYSTSLISVLFTSVFFILIVSYLREDISYAMGYPGNAEYVLWFAVILGLDAFNAIPFAYLRNQNKALTFSMLKVISVLLNILFNIFFLVIMPNLIQHDIPELLKVIYDENIGVGYVFISNLIATVMTTLMLIPYVIKAKLQFSLPLLVRMLKYSLPLMIAGFVGNVNEALDRIILKHLLPDNVDALGALGIYGANIKVAVLMMLYIQMFRYAFEPYFFQKGGGQDAKEVYAEILKFFVLFGLIILVGIVLFLDLIKFIIDENYWGGLEIVPVLLFANLFLGIFYNLSVWYKIKNLTQYGAYLAVFGAVITVLINFTLVPEFGYHASAWARFICYFLMVMLSYFIGRKFLKINYPVKKIGHYAVIAGIIVLLALNIEFENLVLNNAIRIIILGLFIKYIDSREKLVKALIRK